MTYPESRRARLSGRPYRGGSAVDGAAAVWCVLRSGELCYLDDHIEGGCRLVVVEQCVVVPAPAASHRSDGSPCFEAFRDR
jgi:hypothetical protein